MTKKELIDMLSVIPDNAKIQITDETRNFLGHWINAVDIRGFYEHNGSYILCAQKVRPYITELHD